MLLKFETEQEWKAARAQDITSTEIAALFGMSDYKSRLRLWHEKAGNVESDFEDSPHTRWGRRLQVAIGAGIAEDEGWEAEDLTLFYLRCPKTRLGASMDMRVLDPARTAPGLLEVKRTNALTEDMGWFKDRAPLPYEFQIQGQVHLAIKDGQAIGWGAIGVLGGHSQTRVYPRAYDSGLAALVEEEAAKFWRSIELNEPPAPDYAVDSELIRKLQGPVDLGRTISLSGNNKAHDLIQKYLDRKGIVEGYLCGMKEPMAETEKIRAEIWDMMGTAEQAIIGDYVIKAREQHVEDKLVNGYSFRRFDISKRKGTKK